MGYNIVLLYYYASVKSVLFMHIKVFSSFRVLYAQYSDLPIIPNRRVLL